MSTSDVVTFGCRLNAHESAAIQEQLSRAGIEDTIVVNTCAVTKEATRQARQRIRRIRQDRPDATVVVTGCAAQIDPERFSQMPEVDLVLGNAEKGHILDHLKADAGAVQVSDIMTTEVATPAITTAFEGRARATLEIQNGCDHRCTFCVIPFGRGNSRSVAPEAVLGEARRIVEAGYQEIVLTGVDITGYGNDLSDKPSLGDLCRRILKDVPALRRLRLSSIDSVEVDDTLMGLINDEERLQPHFHLSLQHGSDMILKRMKRRHLRADAIAFAQAARDARPDVIFGADLIAGFPTETDAQADESLTLIDEIGLTWLHVFPFSPRPGTPAARMPQVEGSVIKARAAALRDAGAFAVQKFLQGEAGKSRSVLMEDQHIGRTEHYAFIRTDQAFKPGSVQDIIVTGSDPKSPVRLLGRAA